MTSKRRLQQENELLRSSKASAQNAEQRAWDEVAKYAGFLGNLLALDPSLSRFRTDESDWGGQWDFEGVKAAIEFRKNKDLAQRYTSPVASAGRGIK